jgi:hypothetical protein
LDGGVHRLGVGKAQLPGKGLAKLGLALGRRIRRNLNILKSSRLEPETFKEFTKLSADVLPLGGLIVFCRTGRPMLACGPRRFRLLGVFGLRVWGLSWAVLKFRSRLGLIGPSRRAILTATRVEARRGITHRGWHDQIA